MSGTETKTSRSKIIYGLYDPRDGRLRYVGKTRRGIKRAWEPHSAHCDSWLKGLQAEGLERVVMILERLSDDSTELELNEAERRVIAEAREMGADLTNLTEGGDGLPEGYRFSAETRKRMSESRKGIKFSSEHRSKISSSNKGRTSVWKGKTIPKEVRKKMSEARKRYWEKRKTSL